jgi:hypothetical protein
VKKSSILFAGQIINSVHNSTFTPSVLNISFKFVKCGPEDMQKWGVKTIFVLQGCREGRNQQNINFVEGITYSSSSSTIPTHILYGEFQVPRKWRQIAASCSESGTRLAAERGTTRII